MLWIIERFPQLSLYNKNAPGRILEIHARRSVLPYLKSDLCSDGQNGAVIRLRLSSSDIFSQLPRYLNASTRAQ